MTTPASFEERYLKQSEQTRARRMKWWHEARFGMFIHWGLYSQLGRHEWVMNLEHIPIPEYEKLAMTWKPKMRPAREWAALAKRAGMKYMVLTTKHHEGFLLWDSKLSNYNAVRCGPGRDLVREYVEAAREFGLRVGFYYSLMDWHHPDGHRCAKDEPAHRRFLDYTQGLVRELMSNYGKIDILWYDVSWPLSSPKAWESVKMNAMVRQLQPQIIINNRSQLDEDFGTPEEHITAEPAGRAWEACMTFNGSWGWQPSPPEDWHSTRKVIDMLRTCTAGDGNLVLNIGPKPDGSVPREAVERLTAVGRWLKTYGGVIYGPADHTSLTPIPTGSWTRRGKTMYFWCSRWPGRELAIARLTSKLVRAHLYPHGKLLPFKQDADRLVIKNLPAACPDRAAGVAVIEMTFAEVPQRHHGFGYLTNEQTTPQKARLTQSPFITQWQVSLPVPKTKDVRTARCASLDRNLGWHQLDAENDFLNVHNQYNNADGIVYLANRFKAQTTGLWILQLGHDGGVRLFVDGRSVLCTPDRGNPAIPDRSQVTVKLARGVHEIVVAFDTDQGRGWGIFFRFAIPLSERKAGVKPQFPIRLSR